jgi:Mg2+ and Co2+ transporter CorA
MPSLPRIKRPRGRGPNVVVQRARRDAAELSAAGLSWTHLDPPAVEAAEQLSERFGWHPLDV